MDLTTSKGKYDAALKGFTELRNQIKAIGGPHTLAAYMEPTSALLKGRSELVRDVCAATAQAVIEEQALKFLAMDEEEAAHAKAFLAQDPAAYLRRLTKEVVLRISKLPVADKLGTVVEKI